MSFASGERGLRRCVLSMLETHIVMNSLSFCLVLTLVLLLALLLMLCIMSLMDLTISHMVFGSRENNFEPRRFDYSLCPHRGDHFLCRHSFSAGGSHSHLELRHLDSSCFLSHGSCPTRSNCEVQRTVKTSSSRMVKYCILMIYLTNPNIEPSTLSRSM
jgi:hypothetical protein